MATPNISKATLTVLARLGTIVSTAYDIECEQGVTGIPEAAFYIGMGSNLELWNGLRDMLIESNSIKVSNNLVYLTDKGREVAKRMKRTLEGK